MKSHSGALAAITLIPDENKLTQNDKGALNYTVNFPSGVTQANLSIRNTATAKEVKINLGTSKTGTVELDSGVYTLEIVLHKAGKALLTVPAIRIYDHLITQAVYNFTNQDFADCSEGIITAFSLSGGSAAFDGVIDQTARTITVSVLPTTKVSSLTAVIKHTGHSAASVPPQPDYASPVIYTVTAKGGKTIAYTVQVFKDTLTTVAELTSLLAAHAPNTANSPISVKVQVNLADSAKGWTAILSAIAAAGKYVDLDLSSSTHYRSSFDPGYANTGERYITDLVLPNTTTRIAKGDDSGYFSNFFYFTSLKTLIASGVLKVGRLAFYDHKSLSSVFLPSATSIGYKAFSGCRNLSSVSLPSAASISVHAFYYCTSLSSVSLPSAAFIGNDAFSHCTSLNSVSLPTAAFVSEGAFFHCTNLNSVFLPAATAISRWVFSAAGGTDLTIILGGTAPKLGRKMFDMNMKLFMGPSVPKTVTVKVPSGAAGYGTIPATYSGTDHTNNWGNAFRGIGWDGKKYGNGDMNSGITLHIQYITP